MDPLDEIQSTRIVNVEAIVKAYSPEGQFLITEMSLTGNMPLSELKERQIKWRTVDDSTDAPSALDFGDDFTQIKLEPMRIRVFKVTA